MLLGDSLEGCRGLTVVGGFQFGRRDHADAAVEAAVVEPVDIFEGRELDERSASSAPLIRRLAAEGSRV